jgi:hypothetical protein
MANAAVLRQLRRQQFFSLEPYALKFSNVSLELAVGYELPSVDRSLSLRREAQRADS